MSTVSQVRPSPANKYETFVEEQLGRARSRIRLLDLAAAGLGFLIVTLGYGLLMVVLDRLLDLPSLVRQAAFGAYLVGAVVYLGLTLGRVVFRRINPLYAAKQVEQALPGAKNSVVNYLDLRDQDLPAAIRGAVSHRAAKDLARADLDQAISTRRTGWLGGILGGLCLGLLVLFFLGPPQFFSLLRRAFAPFTETTIATRTQLGIMQPEGGNCTVSVGRAVPILASVFGHIPESNRSDSLRLLYRHQPNDPYTERPLERGDSRNEWGTTVPAAEVQTGFWYKVAGGDAETPEYRVQVRSNPLVETIEVKYHFRPYLNRPDQTTNDPNLEALRGTEVTLTARTNREIREGHIELVGEAKPLAAEKVAEEPRALRFKLTLDKDGTYRIWFTSQEGEHNAEPMPYTIRVKKDNPPRVEVTKLNPVPAQPAAAEKAEEPKDGEKVIELPANGLLQVEGVARDDYGVVGMKLQAEGDVKFARTYREGKSFKLDNGNYPLKLDYKDFVDLGQVKLSNGQPLRAGVEFECWLEAADNCDYPEANVGRSERFKVRIKEVEKDPQKQQQQQQQRQKAQEEQKKHNEKQDQNLQKESQEQQQNKDQPKDNPQQQDGQKEKNGNGGEGQKKPEQTNEPKNGSENQPKEGKSEEGQSGKEQPSDNKGKNSQEKTDKQLEDQAKQLNKALGQEDQGQNKNGQQGNADQKPDTEKKPNQQQGNDGQQPGTDNKPGQQGNADQKPGREQRPNQQGNDGQKPDAGQKPNQQGNDNQKPNSDNKPGQKSTDGQKKPGADNKPNQPGNDSQKPDAGNKADQQSKDGQKPGTDKKPGQQGNDSQKPGADNKPKQPGTDGQKPGTGSKSKQQGTDDQKPGAEKKPGQQSNNGQKSGGEKKPGQQGSEGQKPDAQNKSDQQGNDGQKSDTEKKSNQQGNTSPKPGANDKPNQPGNDGPKAGADKKPGQQGNDSQKPGAENKSNQQGKNGQKPGVEKKPGQQGTEGQKPGTNSKPNQQGNSGQKPDAEKKPGQQGNASQKPSAENKPNQQGDSDQKPGTENKGGQPKNSAGSKNDNDRKPSIDELIKALKNGDAKVREDASKKLEDAKETVKDPALKKAIEDALKEAKGGQPGQKSESGNRKGQSPSEQNNGSKAKQPDQNAQPNDSGNKTGQKNGQEGKAGQKNGQDKQSGEKNGQGNKGSNTPNGEASKDPGKPDKKSPNPGGTPGGGGNNRRGPATNSPDPGKGSEANPLYQQKAGELQLENFKKKVTKDVLKKANMTEEEYRKFLQAYEEMLKRKRPNPAAKDEKLADPKTRGGDLGNLGARHLDPKGKDDKVQRNGVALPPPEYRDAYKEFTEKLSDLERAGNKK